MNKPAIACALVTASLISAPVHASGWAAGAKFGTLGFGAEIYKSVTSTINARVAFNAFSFDDSGTEDDVTYDYEVDLNTMGAMVDWHIFRGGFRLTGGVLANGNEASLVAKPSASYTIGDTTYQPDDVGTLRGKVDFDSVAPYLGFGWGNPVGMGNRLSLNLDVGVLFTGTPVVALSADGLLASNAGFQTDLQREQQNVQEELNDLELYPVIALGLTYKF